MRPSNRSVKASRRCTPPKKIGTIDNTTDTIETATSGKQNDTATLQSTDYPLKWYELVSANPILLVLIFDCDFIIQYCIATLF